MRHFKLFFSHNTHSLLLSLVTLIMLFSCGGEDATNENADTMKASHEECLICGAPLEYLPQAETMECALCHKQVVADTRCANGHYVCDECHSAGVDSVVALCLQDTSKNPVVILEKMMSMSFCHIHGPEHHVLVGSALLTAYHNAGGGIDLADAIGEMIRRGKEIPGGACGRWGCCGAAVSTGIFMSIITGTTPMSQESWGLSNLMTSKALEKVGSVGGPRCCKRDSYLSTLAAIDFVKEHFGIVMERPEIHCGRSHLNNQCIRQRCPFSPITAVK